MGFWQHKSSETLSEALSGLINLSDKGFEQRELLLTNGLPFGSKVQLRNVGGFFNGFFQLQRGLLRDVLRESSNSRAGKCQTLEGLLHQIAV